MIREIFPLWEPGRVPYFDDSYGQQPPSLTSYLLRDGVKKGCVIVCPGGAYAMKADHEGGPVAERINSYGISAVTLDYRVAPYRYPAMQVDLLRAIRYLRYHADELDVDPEKIAVLGFSAGGHLVVSSLCLFDDGCEDGDEVDRVSSRPDAAILCYPVVSLTYETHAGSRQNLLGGLPDEEALAHRLSGELQVKADTPPCFLWHTADDGSVPVSNSIRMFTALCDKGVPAELHIFPHGPHGLGLGDGTHDVSAWPELMAHWLDDLGFIPRS